MPFRSILDELTKQRWSLKKRSLPEPLLAELMEEGHRRFQKGLFHSAGVGKAQELAVRQHIRGDSIQWLDWGQSACTDAYLEHMDALRQTLNQELFLGLVDFECHFALYPPDSFYKTHLDCFQHDDRRTVTAVTYLNPNWVPAHGGIMRLYLPDDSIEEITPLAGHLAVFMSADIPHEVLPTQVERLALTGWFRRRDPQTGTPL